MPLDPNQQKEQYSIAYVHVLATVAGYSTGNLRVDDQSVDLTIIGKKEPHLNFAPRLEVQLKCTEDPDYINKIGESRISYDLKEKNYNDLCETGVVVPRALVLLVVPALDSWFTHTHEFSTLKYCAYWHKLVGLPPIQQTQKRVHLQRTNVLTPKTLRQIMDQIGQTRELP